MKAIHRQLKTYLEMRSFAQHQQLCYETEELRINTMSKKTDP